MDSFDGKRKMVSNLLGALKKDAGDELSRHLGGDSTKKQVTHTPVPKESVAEHTHNKESYKPGSGERQIPQPSTSELNTGASAAMGKPLMPGMSEGGLAGTDMAATDEPERELGTPDQNADGSADAEAVKNLPAPIEDEEAEQTAEQDTHNANIMDEDEDNNSSAFSAFQRKKKR